MKDLILGIDVKPRPLLVKEIWDDSYHTAAHVDSAVVVDIGANIGMYSIWAVNQGASHVYAIEPFIENVEAMTQNLMRCEVSDSVTVIQAGVAAKGTTECKTVIRGGKDEPEVRSTGVQTVPGKGTLAVDFDTVVGLVEGEIDVMKLDCEGAEYDFILTADYDAIRQVKFIALEFHMWTIEGGPPNPAFGVRPSGPLAQQHELLEHLSVTHDIEIVGHIDKGGYMVGRRR